MDGDQVPRMILVENTGSATPSWCVFARSQSVLVNSSFSGGHCISGSSQPFYVHLYGCFLKWWYLQIIHFNRVFHYKPSILGYHYFRKHPYIIPLHSFLPRGSTVSPSAPSAWRWKQWFQPIFCKGRVTWMTGMRLSTGNRRSSGTDDLKETPRNVQTLVLGLVLTSFFPFKNRCRCWERGMDWNQQVSFCTLAIL